MKKVLLLVLGVLTISCFAGCGEAEEDNYAGDNAVVETTVSSEPMTAEQKEAFLATYDDFVNLMNNFGEIYGRDEVEQNDKYEAFLDSAKALSDEINEVDVDTLPYSDAAVYVQSMTEFAETSDAYIAEIKEALGM